MTQVQPTQINEAFVHKQVAKFLDELMNWEKSPQIPTVGYKIPDKQQSKRSSEKALKVLGAAAAATAQTLPKK